VTFDESNSVEVEDLPEMVPVMLAFEGYPTNDPDLFAVSPNWKFWSITHGPTGRTVSGHYLYDTPQEAIEAANRVTQVISGAEMTARRENQQDLTTDERVRLSKALDPGFFNCECDSLPCRCPDDVLKRWP
jgi:hypothetical protein